MHIVELGGVRLHVLTVHPGVPGEADRTARELSLLDPAVVVLDLDTEETLRVLEAVAGRQRRYDAAWSDALLASESARRFGRESEREDSPFVAAARVAKNRKASVVALRPATKQPGLFARMGTRSAVRAAPGADAESFARAFGATLAKRHPALDPVAQVRAGMPRLQRALDDGRAPVAVLVQAHRAEALLREVRQMPRGVAPA